jgi:putative transposase
MACPLRLEFPGALYHLTSRGNARAPIVLDDEDRHIFFSVLGEIIGRFDRSTWHWGRPTMRDA